ncbi:tail fiber protein [Pasteurella multocida]|uniref:tail fiber protein n=1 Tax=Pasteurella multocida TaxID=747 RepID=UPI000E043676|nr:tail fiber protein [Pasteurella multocida]SUB46764.1 Phage tail fibre repeat [Pasteurella multocida subsp. septica]
MADFNKPTVDSHYTQFPNEIKAAVNAALSFLDGGSHTNIPLKAKRWNPTNKIFEEYSGTQWVPMATEYKLPVDYNALRNKPVPSSLTNSNSETTFANSKAVKTVADSVTQISNSLSGYITNSKKSDSANSSSSDTVATSKAVKSVTDSVAQIANSLNSYIPNSKKSNATNSNSSDTVATSKAVKTVADIANGKAALVHTHDVSDISNFEQSVLSLINANSDNVRVLWSGNAGQGSTINLGENVLNHTLIFLSVMTQGQTLTGNNQVFLSSFYIPEISGKTTGSINYMRTIYYGNAQEYYISISITPNGRTINIAPPGNLYIKAIYII